MSQENIKEGQLALRNLHFPKTKHRTIVPRVKHHQSSDTYNQFSTSLPVKMVKRARGERRDQWDLVDMSFDEVRHNTGTDYPCTRRELRSLRCKGRSFRAPILPRPWSPDEACDRLLNFLNQSSGRNPDIDAALGRIGNALQLREWGPDLIIKAFHDLDRAFFAATLAGSTKVEWASQEEFAAQGSTLVRGHTMGQDFGGSLIQLNAEFIFRDGSEGHFSDMWRTVSNTLSYYNASDMNNFETFADAA